MIELLTACEEAAAQRRRRGGGAASPASAKSGEAGDDAWSLASWPGTAEQMALLAAAKGFTHAEMSGLHEDQRITDAQVGALRCAAVRLRPHLPSRC